MADSYKIKTYTDPDGNKGAFKTVTKAVYDEVDDLFLDAKLANVDTAIAANTSAISTLNQNLVWKLAGTVSGTAPISIPKGASELFIMATASHGDRLSLSIPIISLTADTQYFALTAFQHSDNTVGSGLVTATSANVTVYSMRFQNADITNSAILNLYYR